MSNDNTAKPSAGPWLRIGTMVYALESCGWRKGEEQFRNRFDARVQGAHTDHEELVWNAIIMQEAGMVYHETSLTPRQLAEQRDELLAALAPFAAFAKHFPAERKFGNRPTSGVIYSMASGGMPDAEFTAEQLRAAAAIIAKVEAKP